MSTQSTPRYYREAGRDAAFRIEKLPANWAHNEICQIDLPSGYRCHVVTKLNNYRFNGDGFTAETTYLGRVVRFSQVSTTVGGEALEDWVPVDVNGKRCKLILPTIEYHLLTNRKRLNKLIFKGAGVLRSTIGYSGEGSELSAERDNYTRPPELREWLIAHYTSKYSLPWINDGVALLRAVKEEHDLIEYAQSKDSSW